MILVQYKYYQKELWQIIIFWALPNSIWIHFLGSLPYLPMSTSSHSSHY